MRIVVDTNIFIASISKFSPFHWIYEKFIDKEYDIVVTTDILLEYQEKINEKYGLITCSEFIFTILTAKNTIFCQNYFFWNLINQDPSDNKFVDCYVSSASDYILTEDKHYNILKNIDFPKVKIIGIKEFAKILGRE